MARSRLNSSSKPGEELPKAKINKKTLAKAAQLLGYLKPYRRRFTAGMVFLFLSSLVGLAFPAFLGALIDAAGGQQRFTLIPPRLDVIGLLAFSVLFVQAFVSFFRILWFVQVAERSLADIRRDTYFKLITLPMDFFANRRVGELNSRISADLSQIQDAITTTLAEMIRQIILLIGGITMLAIVSAKLTLLMLVILPVLVAVAVFFGRFIRKISREAQDQLAQSNTIVEETLQGITNVKAFVNEAYEAGRYKASIGKVVDIAVRGAKFRGIFASFVVFCLFGTIVGVIWYGSHLVQHGDLSVGSLTTFILYAVFVAAAMGSFPELYANMQKAVGATERVLEILDEKGEDISVQISDHKISIPMKGRLTFDRVRFAYPSRPEIEVLKGVSFEVGAGEKVAVVGPSGAGKSTLASLILQFYHPLQGKILFDDKPAADFTLADIRSQVAIVPQDVMLFGGTIRENILYGKMSSNRQQVEEAARRANAHPFIMNFPEGYETVVGERGIKLSGGQRQRIAIARALLKNPSVLILDEATSSLDSESERLVQEALEELMKNRTSIIVAHRLSTIREADKIIVLDKGVIAESGRHGELLLNENGLYRHLSQLQFEI